MSKMNRKGALTGVLILAAVGLAGCAKESGSKGSMIEEKVTRNYDGEGEITGWQQESFDRNGNVKECRVYDRDGGLLRTQAVTETDSKGRKTVQVLKDGDGTELANVEYTYDRRGNLTGCVSTGTPENCFSCEYGYDENDRKVYSISYEADGKTITAYEDYQYDADGNLIMTDGKFYYDSYMEEYTYEYRYDAKGKLISETLLSGSEITEKSEYVYDDGDRLLRVETDSRFDRDRKEEYRYDEKGNVSSAVRTSEDGETTGRTEYEYTYGAQ